MSVYFKEEQGFASWILWVMGLATLLGIGGVLYQLIQQGSVPESDSKRLDLIIVSIFTFLALFVANLMIFRSRLLVEIKNGFLWYRFIPFHFSSKKISRDQIVSWQIRKISPLVESRGFGYKWGPNKRSMIMKGSWVLTLVRKKGPKLNLGTQRPEELKKEMEKFMNPIEEY